MAQKTDAQLTTEANIIRDETAIGANTALRVGIMLDNLIDSKTNNDIISNAPLGTSTSIVPTQNAVKTYADGLVVGLLDDRGNFDASTGGSPYPSINGSGAGGVIQKGDIYFISVAGTVGTTPVSIGSSVRALVDTPAQTAANWDVLDAGVGFIAEPAANKSDAASLGGATPSHTLFPTQYAVKTYADGAFNPLIGWTTENVTNKIQDLTIAPTSAVQYPSSAAVTIYAEPTVNKSNDNTLGGVTPSATLFPTQNAVKTYVDAHTSTATLQSVVAAGHTTDATQILMQNSTGSGLALASNVSDAVGGIFIDAARGVNVHLSDSAGNGVAILKAVDSLTDVRILEFPNASGTIALQSYKVYTALLTQSGGDNATSITGGEFSVVGVTYEILLNDSGFDFIPYGAPNNNIGTTFVANAIFLLPNEPTELGFNSGAPVVKVLENTIGNVWFTYGGDGGYTVNSNSLFTNNKSLIIIGNVTWDGGSGIIKSGFDGESIGSIITALANGDPLNNASLINTPIEIRVYS